MALFKRHAATILTCAVLFGVGCDSGGFEEDDASVSADVAESVAALQGDDTGGMMEQVSDLFLFAEEGAMTGPEVAGKSEDDFYQRVYDSDTGVWTVTKSREVGDPEGPRYAAFTRVYELQYLDAADEPQKYYNTSGSIAASIRFTVLEGGGTLTTPRISAERSVLSAEWLATGTDTDTVTVNGSYARSGGHTITGAEGMRTVEYEASFDVMDLVGPRGSRRDLSQKVSGTIVGSYDATIVMERGDQVQERSVSKDVTIVIENGISSISVEGAVFRGDVASGEVAG